ncbi:hypothetical protein ThidrDRAFT_2948 [Thiorhodococcus drewsii AZ1]|uniref:Uncharacterized protein n=1 Tax=Thiorhodococcus drewsii AZ1 TaxID=765913 RepID=G2E3T5_9GAMM|nr:hypothetical protein ThidrDRAFT_2948 [Thiorhodococcus drewsii AZ1]
MHDIMPLRWIGNVGNWECTSFIESSGFQLLYKLKNELG